MIWFYLLSVPASDGTMGSTPSAMQSVSAEPLFKPLALRSVSSQENPLRKWPNVPYLGLGVLAVFDGEIAGSFHHAPSPWRFESLAQHPSPDYASASRRGRTSSSWGPGPPPPSSARPWGPYTSAPAPKTFPASPGRRSPPCPRPSSSGSRQRESNSKP